MISCYIFLFWYFQGRIQASDMKPQSRGSITKENAPTQMNGKLLYSHDQDLHAIKTRPTCSPLQAVVTGVFDCNQRNEVFPLIDWRWWHDNRMRLQAWSDAKNYLLWPVQCKTSLTDWLILPFHLVNARIQVIDLFYINILDINSIYGISGNLNF